MLQKGKYFWSQDQFVPKTLVLFENPHLLVLADLKVNGRGNPNRGIGIGSSGSSSSNGSSGGGGGDGDGDSSTRSQGGVNALWVERVVDLQTCKLRLSTLTTPTSVGNLSNDDASAIVSTGTGAIDSTGTSTAANSNSTVTSSGINCRNMSCFEIMTPSENISISAMKHGDNSKMTYATTVRWEDEIGQAILSAHGINVPVHVGGVQEAGGDGACMDLNLDADGSNDHDWSGTSSHAPAQGLQPANIPTPAVPKPKPVEITPTADLTIWRHRHQLILGTLHSHVVSGNYALLKQFLSPRGSPLTPFPNINQRDGAGLTPLHYACFKRSYTLVTILLNAGADCSLPTASPFPGRNTPCHITASLLDEKSLSVILSCSKPCRADPNALNDDGKTPMAVALNAGAGAGAGVDSGMGAGALVLDPVDSGLGSGVGSRTMCVDALRAWGGQIALRKKENTNVEASWYGRKNKNPLQTTRDDEESAKNKLFGTIGRAMKNLFSDDDDDDMESELVQDPVRTSSSSMHSRSNTSSTSSRTGPRTRIRTPTGTSDQSTNDQLSGLMGTMDATRNAFHERGEKLNTLSEKTGALRDASEDFAKMAEELCKSQEKGIFGLW